MKAEPLIPEGLIQIPQPVAALQRREGLFDLRLDEVLALAEYLLTHGAFHIKLHFSGDQLTCWWFNDPMRYQIYRGEEALADRVLDKCSDAELLGLAISEPEVREILQGFKDLRLAEDTSYLRSASLNRVNGMLGLSFTCDNIHYIPHRDYPAFLANLSAG